MADLRNLGGAAPGAGAMLGLIRDKASTRAELVASTGLARSTVSQRMDALLSQGLVVPVGENASTGGRPPQTFAFNADAGVILVAGLGATHSTIAITNLAAEVLAEEPLEVSIADGPEPVMARVDEVFTRLLAEIGRTEARRPRRRRRRSRPRRVRDRHAGRATDHARLARLPARRAAARSLGRAGARRQRRQPHGPRRAVGRLPRLPAHAVREGRHGDRLRDHHRRPDPPRRARLGRGHRPHPRSGARRRPLPLRQPGLPRGRGRWRGDGARAGRRGDPDEERPRRRPPRPRGQAARDAGRAPGGARARRGPRGVGQLLQPGDHRHRRRHRPRRRAPPGRGARARLPAGGAARHAVAAHRALASSAITAASSAARSWSSSTSCRRRRSTG